MEQTKPYIKKLALGITAATLLAVSAVLSIDIMGLIYHTASGAGLIIAVCRLVCAVLAFTIGKKSLFPAFLAAIAAALMSAILHIVIAWDTAYYIEYLFEWDALMFLVPGVVFLALTVLILISAFKGSAYLPAAILCFFLSVWSIIVMNSPMSCLGNLGLGLLLLSCMGVLGESPKRRTTAEADSDAIPSSNQSNINQESIHTTNDQNSLLLEQKSIAVALLLSFVTFGIYYIIWTFGVCKKIRLMAGEEPRCGGELACILLVPFYSLFWFHSRSKKLAQAAGNCGIALEDKSVINLLLAIFGFGIVSMALIQADLNRAAAAFGAAVAQG